MASVRHAKGAEGCGVDAVIAEGYEAGGHLGNEELPLFALIPQVADSVEIPVIAAGGIYSGKDMFRIIKRGASAVQLGTRFIATRECDASSDFKKAFMNAKSKDIKIIKSPVGLPGRTIFNQFLSEADKGNRRPVSCKYNCIKTCDPKSTPFCIANALLEASRGNLASGFAFTGSNAGKVEEISTVRSVFRELIEGYNREKQ